MSDFGELVDRFGPFGAMLVVLVIVLGVVLRYFKGKIDSWGEPWVMGQIEHTKSLTESTKTQAASSESQAKSLESLVKAFEALSISFKAIEQSTERQTQSTAAQTQSNKLVAIGLSQLLDASKEISKEQVEALERRFSDLEDKVLRQDVAAGRIPPDKAETYQHPKLKMEPMMDEESRSMEAEVEELKDELTPEPEEEK